MITVILPTLGEREKEIKRLFESLDKQTYKNFEVIVVSQDNHDKVGSYLLKTSFKYEHIRINRKGISIARNEALKYISGNIITFSDDDCWYLEESFADINRWFNEKNSDICVFQHFDPEKNEYSKKYSEREERNISKRKIISQSSIDIFINIEKVKDYYIGFDERFGVGSKYNAGEEGIYLNDLHNKGYTIDYCPKIISYHPNKRGVKYMEEKSIVSKAPLFKRLFGSTVGIIMYFIFILKKHKMIENKFKCIVKGIQEYKKFKLM